MSIGERLQELDQRQQRSPRVSFIAGVVKKFSDDQGAQLAALIAYYGFVSIFPLVLVLVTVLGFVLHGNPTEQEELLNGTLGQYPILRDPLKVHALSGSGLALGVGIAAALLAGLGITNAAQSAFNRIWSVPFRQRPNFILARLRGLGMLTILGAMSIISTVAAGSIGTASHGAAAVMARILVAFAFNLALFMTAFKVLTAIDLKWRDLVAGVVVAAVGWQLLQYLGGFYLHAELKRTGPLYGIFAAVLGLVAWLYLGAQVMVFAAEINVVKARRLWPRSLFSDSLLDADRRALTFSAEAEERVHRQNVEVDFDPPE